MASSIPLEAVLRVWIPADKKHSQILFSETEKLLEKWKHPDPYRPPTAPGGKLLDLSWVWPQGVADSILSRLQVRTKSAWSRLAATIEGVCEEIMMESVSSWTLRWTCTYCQNASGALHWLGCANTSMGRPAQPWNFCFCNIVEAVPKIRSWSVMLPQMRLALRFQ